MSPEVIQLLRNRRSKLTGLSVSKSNWTNLTEWHAGTEPLIAEKFSKHLAKFKEIIRVRWTMNVGAVPATGANTPADVQNNQKAQNAKQQLLQLIDGILAVYSIDDSQTEREPVTPIPLPVAKLKTDTSKMTQDIFIVHGHDGELLQNAARFIERLGLKPIILHEQPNGGKTLIEKFEEHADVGFAVTLLTPDDTGYQASESPKTAQPRARQNVILELGYFAGRLTRKRVFCLLGKEVEIPSDLRGIVYTSYDQLGHWKTLLARELKAAGYSINAEALL